MVAFNNLHKLAIERWIKARNPDLDVQSVDVYSIWDSSLSASENHRIIQEKLREYGIVSDSWTKQECYGWEQRAKEWYEDELRKYQHIPEPEIEPIENIIQDQLEYVEISGTWQISGFYGDETVYAIIRPPTIDYERASYFLGLVESDLDLLQKMLGGVYNVQRRVL